MRSRSRREGAHVGPPGRGENRPDQPEGVFQACRPTSGGATGGENLVRKQVKELAQAIAEYMDAEVKELDDSGFHVADEDGWFEISADLEDLPQFISGEIRYYDDEKEIGNTHPFEHRPGLCDSCRYNRPDGCIYKGPARCVVLDDLLERLRAIDDARWTRLGLIDIAPAYKEVNCEFGSSGKHYYPGVIVRFRWLTGPEVLALVVLTRALIAGIKKRIIGM